MRFLASEHIRYLLIIQGEWWAIVPHSDDPDSTRLPKSGLIGYDTRDHWNRWGNYDFDCQGMGDAKYRATIHTPESYDWSGTATPTMGWYGRAGTVFDKNRMRVGGGVALVCDDTSELKYGRGNYGP